MIFKSKPRITQHFSDNSVYYKQFGLWGHEGLDLVPTGDDWTIFLPFDGVVVRKYESTVYGNTLIIQEVGGDMSWRFAHMDSVYVREKDIIHADDPIGTMGATPVGRDGIGGTMPAHLHINCIPQRPGKDREFPNNGFKGRVDPLGVLWSKGELR